MPPSFPSGQREREECKKRRIVPPLPLRLSLPSPVDRVREILGHQFGGPFEGDRLAGGDGLDGHVYGLGMRAVREQAQAGSPFFLLLLLCAGGPLLSPVIFLNLSVSPRRGPARARVCAPAPLSHFAHAPTRWRPVPMPATGGWWPGCVVVFVGQRRLARPPGGGAPRPSPRHTRDLSRQEDGGDRLRACPAAALLLIA